MYNLLDGFAFGYDNLVNVVMLVNHSLQIRAERSACNRTERLPVELLLGGIRGQHIEEVDVVTLEDECVAVEQSVIVVTVQEQTIRYVFKILVSVVAVVITLHNSADEEVWRDVVTMRVLVSVRQVILLTAILLRIETFPYIDVSLDDILGVSVLLRDGVLANRFSWLVILAVANVVDQLVIHERFVLVEVIDNLAIVLILQFVMIFFIADKLIHHVLKDILEVLHQ